MLDYLTTLTIDQDYDRPRAHLKHACKQWILDVARQGGELGGRWTVIGYDKPSFWRHKRIAIDLSEGIVGMLETLQGMASDPYTIAIHGCLLPDVDDSGPVMRRGPKVTVNGPPWFSNANHMYQMLDLDNGTIWPMGRPAETQAEMLQAARHNWMLYAPPGLEDADVVVQLSNSIGFSEDFKAHFWVALDRPTCHESWRRFLDKTYQGMRKTPLDASVHKAVQPLYTADPIVRNGPDPMAELGIERVFFCEGRERFGTPPKKVVDLETLELLDAPKKGGRKPRPPINATEEEVEAVLLERLREYCSDIRCAPVGGRHEAANKAGYTMAGWLSHRGAPSDGHVYRELVEAATGAGMPESRARDEVRRGMDDGAMKAMSIDGLVGAMRAEEKDRERAAQRRESRARSAAETSESAAETSASDDVEKQGAPRDEQSDPDPVSDSGASSEGAKEHTGTSGPDGCDDAVGSSGTAAETSSEEKKPKDPPLFPRLGPAYDSQYDTDWFDTMVDSDMALAERSILTYERPEHALDTPLSQRLVATEGALWRHETETGLWVEITAAELMSRLRRWDGREYGDDEDRAPMVRISDRRREGVYICMMLLRCVDPAGISHETFFSDAPCGFATQSGFVRVDLDEASITMDQLGPEHRQRHRLECEVDLSWLKIDEEQGLWGKEGTLLRRYLCSAHDQEEVPEEEQAARVRVMGEAIFAALTQTGPWWHRAIVAVGVAGTGKSQFMHMVEALMPAGATSNVSPQGIGDKTEVGDLKGKWLNVCHETKPTGMALDRLKCVITGEPVSANPKYRQPFSFTPRLLVMFSSNPDSLPRAKDADQALWDRLRVLAFDRVFRDTGKDVKDIGKRIAREETQYLVQQALWCGQAMLPRKQYTEPACHRDLTSEWKLDNDMVAVWLEECTETHHSEVAVNWPKCSQLRSAYIKWLDKSEEKPPNPRQFVASLKKHDITITKSKGTNRAPLKLQEEKDSGLFGAQTRAA